MVWGFLATGRDWQTLKLGFTCLPHDRHILTHRLRKRDILSEFRFHISTDENFNNLLATRSSHTLSQSLSSSTKQSKDHMKTLERSTTLKLTKDIVKENFLEMFGEILQQI